MMKLTISLIALVTSLSAMPSVLAEESSMFLFELAEERSENLHQTIQEYDLEEGQHVPFFSGVDYQPECGTKCGVRNTSLFLLYMVAEAKVEREYRTRLILPNYEP